MAPWALLSPGVLVRTGHTVLTWGITLVLFLHDTGERAPGTTLSLRGVLAPCWGPTGLPHHHLSKLPAEVLTFGPA